MVTRRKGKGSFFAGSQSPGGRIRGPEHAAKKWTPVFA
jgi:hypothetical protein